MDVILATRNPSKAEQIKAIFNGSLISILTLEDIGIKGEAEEDGDTLEQNAQKKAMFAARKLKPRRWVMAEDTGLFIHALNGVPGIRAARWAGERATTAQITQYTLRQLKGMTNRTALFETVVVIISPLGKYCKFSGMVKGQILKEQRVEPQPNMPYSGIFVPEGETLTWAEMDTQYENQISHRGKAFRQALAFLTTTAGQ